MPSPGRALQGGGGGVGAGGVPVLWVEGGAEGAAGGPAGGGGGEGEGEGQGGEERDEEGEGDGGRINWTSKLVRSLLFFNVTEPAAMNGRAQPFSKYDNLT